ncbi:MAG TPA: hypothetical protein VKV17_22960 [Bryobacteraceae bacterium]|nr:hypothetical protein [Bryobacteraceae bacterium]
MSDAVFHEVQRLRQWHIRIVLALPPAALLFITIRQVVFHHPWGEHPISNGGLIFLTVLLVAVYLRLITVRLVTNVSAGELAVGLRGLWKLRRVPLSAIRSAKPVEYSPLDYGGYGIRSGPGGLAYIADGNRAVQLELRDGSKLLIGSQRAEELARAVGQAH